MQFSRSCRLAFLLSTTTTTITTAFTTSKTIPRQTATAFLHRRTPPITIATAYIGRRTQYHHYHPNPPSKAHHNRRSSSNNNNNRSLVSSAMSSSSSPNKTNEPKTPNRIALLQFTVTSCKTTNHSTARSRIQSAAEQGASLVVLPEIWNGPYATAAFGEYAETVPSIGYSLPNEEENKEGPNGDECGESIVLLLQEAKRHGLYVVGGSVAERTEDGRIYNTCVVVDPHGTIVAKHRKVHLFDIDVPGGITFRESDTLSPGGSATWFDAGEELGVVGIGICYDIRFPEYSLLLTQTKKCNILIFPGAFNLTTGPAHWELLQRGRAVDNQCYVLTASPARVNPPPKEDDDHNTDNDSKKKKYPHYTAWGHSTAVSPWGDVVATCGAEEAIVVCDLDISKVREMREGIPVSKQKREDLYRLTGECDGGIGGGGGTKRSRGVEEE